MSTRKTTLIYSLPIAVASLAVGMILASRLDLTPSSSAQIIAAPPMNSAPISGSIDAQTFRTIAKSVSPAVVNVRTESHQREQELKAEAPEDRSRANRAAVGRQRIRNGGDEGQTAERL